ncbi:gluconeogenesis factor YvcK family protein [Aerococcus kribbianus]|uniref:Putative gluconeogenesis factor n=1 Tax=Aerococcus kribbianus TaxID=2999064 RepID=A0A9X3FN09_9LACT|nr:MULTISPECIES: uridine diphosphate-N-acetylglucosamine-binding protein YvcK [unclassified Aerococcus]MCZ0717480.1 uridine diphosphate-N-acetylglucosamine-binding protein YvcK [Aerococcus sp. YH-aer221]MCZ0725768.1 uridine diphosphate-N-acetylglucosamine-binding protein YvcK [Aerococcus sp. YH-aer222]
MISTQNKFDYRQPKVTVIGGGTGLPILLSGLKEAKCDVSAVVTVADDGGSSGSLRTSLNTIPPGDIRNCLVALSDAKQIYKDIFQYRFAPEDNEFSGHAIGNLIIAALAEMRGDVHHALKLLQVMMAIHGQVLPACPYPLVLQAHYADGSMIEGETRIVAEKRPIDCVSVRVANPDKRPDAQPTAGNNVVKAIMEADIVVLGPGSLYTSILPNVVIEEIRQALLDTPAKVVYICNIMTQLGETEHFTDADHLRVINEHLQAKAVDYALINKTTVPYEYIESKETPEYLVQVVHDKQGLLKEKTKIIGADFLNLKESGVYHDQRKLVAEILKIYRGDY